ncbi:MAG: MXAN_5187 C-terminal domain-containing protein [Terriglobales bacterium]
MTVDEELNQLDDSVRRLKIEYDVFFGGGAKKPPTDLEWRVQSLLKKYSDGRKMSFSQRFKFNSIQQKFAVFNSLWQQKLRIKEEGYRRPQDALLAIQGVRMFEENGHHAQINEVNDGEPQPFRISCSDAEAELHNVKALYEAMVQAGKQSKAKAPAGSFESFQKFVKKKTDQLRKEYGSSAVEFAVEVEDGKVRLRAKAQ